MHMTQTQRKSSPPRPSFTEGVAQRVIEACRIEDPAARITYVGRDEHKRTRVRVRSGGSASVQALQRALCRLMPYATVRTSEDVLDGSVQAEIIVPTKADEYGMARDAAASRLLNRGLAVAAFLLLVVGVGMWAVDAVLAMSGVSAGARDI